MTSRLDLPAGDGAAVIEFVAVTLVMILPVAFALAAVLRIHTERLTAQSAAAGAALALAREGGGHVRAERIVRGYWDRPADISTTVVCRPDCTRPGALVTVRVGVSVPLPIWPGTVDVHHDHSQVVDRYVSR